MYRLSLIIGEIYNKFLPLTENGQIRLNLDFSDTTKEVADQESLRSDLESALESAFQRTDHGDINISVDSEKILITDSGTILSKAACALLSNRRVEVSSRVGFGTTVSISLKNREPVHQETATMPETLASPNMEKSPKSTNIAKAPQASTSSKAGSDTKISPAPSRKLQAAAKKTNKKVQKLAKKAQKHLAKVQKKSSVSKTSASSSQKPKSSAKSRKVIHKLDFS